MALVPLEDIATKCVCKLIVVMQASADDVGFASRVIVTVVN